MCLVRLLVALAIDAKAFKYFDTAQSVLDQKPPPDFNGQYFEAEWKEELLDEHLVSVSDSTFRKVWHRTCTVAGLSGTLRPYSLRVGAGMRLNGRPVHNPLKA